MIITRERLIELGRREATERGERQRLAAVYLVGSVVEGDPLVGGSADIDLVLIHNLSPLRPREIVRLSTDVHLDLHHRARAEFEAPRQLRTDPDLGPALCHSIRLHDPEHFFDWVQASACAQFHHPSNRMARARALLTRARTLQRSLSVDDGWQRRLASAAVDGANAAATLGGQPAHGRRLVPGLRTRLDALDQLALFAGFLRVFDADQSAGWDLPGWMAHWAKAYDASLEQSEDKVRAPVRRDYFLRAFQTLAEADMAEAVVVPLLLTWPALDAEQVPEVVMADCTGARQSLYAACGLQDAKLAERRTRLDAFLDDVELFLEAWGSEHGA